MADRLGDVGAFDARDVTLLQTLAGHAGVALERSRLIDDLRREAAEREHQALHDGLTGLANRALFLDRVRQAIAGLGPGVSLAVLLVDLDRFKEVNDTLGHSHRRPGPARGRDPAGAHPAREPHRSPGSAATSSPCWCRPCPTGRPPSGSPAPSGPSWSGP